MGVYVVFVITDLKPITANLGFKPIDDNEYVYIHPALTCEGRGLRRVPLLPPHEWPCLAAAGQRL